MSQESREAFIDAIENKIEYFRHEFDLDYGDVVSGLEFVKHKMLKEAFEEVEHD